MKQQRKQLKKAKKTELEKLTDFWYKKLQRSGFKDIEDKAGYLRQYSNIFSKRAAIAQVEVETKEEYFRMATHFGTEHNFPNKAYKFIWENHAEGFSVREIATLLKKNKIMRTNRGTVFNIIQELKSIMLKKYGVGTKDE